MKVLAVESAYQTGASLWFTPDLNVSSWTREIDWYLGFQIFHARGFTPKPLPAEIRRVLDDNGWSATDQTTSTSETLALVVEDKLPADNLLVVSAPDAKDWLEACLEIWNKAKRPPTRLFLPAAVTLQLAQKIWPANEDISVVLNR